jgi:hypothetical protein
MASNVHGAPVQGRVEEVASKPRRQEGDSSRRGEPKYTQGPRSTAAIPSVVGKEKAWASYEKVYRSTPPRVSPLRGTLGCRKAAHPSFNKVQHTYKRWQDVPYSPCSNE